MKLEDFRKIALEGDLATARKMATPQQQRGTVLSKSPAKSSILSDKSVDNPKIVKSVKISDKVIKEKSPDKFLPSRTQFPIKSVIKNNKDQISESNLNLGGITSATAEQVDCKNETATTTTTNSFLLSYLQIPLTFWSYIVSVYQCLIQVPSTLLTWIKIKCDIWIVGSPILPSVLCLIGLYLASFVSMTYPLFALCRLVLGTLYPAYASYKAVRTKNVREYVKWMMYWIVFALFTSFETFADVFVAFWFPFYYELKILVLLWLISPVSRGSLGSSILYRRFIHPQLLKREEEIDHMILRLQEQGYNTVTRLAGRAFTYVSDFVMQTAIRGGGGLVYQLRKSYSLTDLANPDAYDDGSPQRMRPSASDRFRPSPQITDITDSFEEEDASVRRKIGRSNFDRKDVSASQFSTNQGYYFPESDMIDNQHRKLRSSSNRDTPRHSARTDITSPDNLSSGYSSSTAELSSFLPMSADEMMDTDDYELYNPRIHGLRSRQPGAVVRSKSFGRGGNSSNMPGGLSGAVRGRNPRSKQEVSHYGTLPRSYAKKTSVQSIFKQQT